MLCRMGDENDKLAPLDYVVESIKAEIELSTPSRRQRIFEAIALAALGSIPWLGGVIAAASSAAGRYKEGESQAQRDDLLKEWLQEHQEKLQKLRSTLEQMVRRIEGFGEKVEERITSKEYLTLVRKTFRQWDEADTTKNADCSCS
jgi:methylthioribose-1-phosphate isomerase